MRSKRAQSQPTADGTSASRIQIGPKRKIAFVCSGGATKAGAFHLGVALALQEQGFSFQGGMTSVPGVQPRAARPMEISTYVGSSAGSIISSFLAAGFSLDNIFNSFLGRTPIDPRDTLPRILPSLTYQRMFKLRKGELAREQLKQIMNFRSIAGDLLRGQWDQVFHLKWLQSTGFFTTAGIEEFMREEVLPSNRFQDCIADLFIVATQLNHSRKVVFGKYHYNPPAHDLTCQYDNNVPISEACAASTSLPLIYSPYAITNQEGKKIEYIDGEIRDTLSSHVAIDAGADLVIASYTHQPLHIEKTMKSMTEYGLPAILIQSAYLLIEQKINNHVHNKEIQRNAILAVSRYCKQQGVSEDHSKRICEILEAELHHRLDVDTIYIHPNPQDSAMFFGDHFSLSSKRLAETVRSGFRAAIDVLRRYEFADRVEKPRAVPAS